jgi:hypothetical protein
MDGKHSYQENRRHGQADQRNEGAKQHGQATKQFNEKRKPCHQMRCGNADDVEDTPEHVISLA